MFRTVRRGPPPAKCQTTPEQRTESADLTAWFSADAERDQRLTDLGLLAIALLVVILITLGVI